MIDYSQPPVAYLVRVPLADQDSLTDAGRRQAEEAARFLGYEEIGPVVCSGPVPAAVEAADIIFTNVKTSFSGFEIDWHLAETVGAYIRNRGAGPPTVLVCDLPALRAGLRAAGVDKGRGDQSEAEIIAPGGIVSIHRGADGKLTAVARTMILDFSFQEFL